MSLSSCLPWSQDDHGLLESLEQAYTGNTSVKPPRIDIDRASNALASIHQLIVDETFSDEDWSDAMKENGDQVLHTIIRTFAFLPLSPASIHHALHSLKKFLLIDYSLVSKLAFTHNTFIEKLFQSIDPTLAKNELLVRLQLLYALLIACNMYELPLSLDEDTLVDVLHSLLACLTLSNTILFTLSMYITVLLNNSTEQSIFVSMLTDPNQSTEIAGLLKADLNAEEYKATHNEWGESLSLYGQEMLKLLNQGALASIMEDKIAELSGTTTPKIELTAEEEEVIKRSHRKLSKEIRDEARILALQRGEEFNQRHYSPFMTRGVLKLIAQLYESHHDNFFYTNDVYVMCDVLIQTIENYSGSSDNEDGINTMLLKCTLALLSSPEYASIKYKLDQLLAVTTDLRWEDPTRIELTSAIIDRLQYLLSHD